MKAILGDVVQLDPDQGPGEMWGGLLCIVDDATPGGRFLRVYALMPTTRGQAPACMWLRVARTQCRVIGRSAFCDWVER